MKPTLSSIKSSLSHLSLKMSCFAMGCSAALAGEASQTSANNGIGAMASRVQGSMANIASLIGSVSYVVGLGFFIACLLKFKQHRDNPTQVPIGMPFTYLGIAVLLVFLPNLVVETGNTVFSNATSYGVTATSFSDIQVKG
ncbi:MAG: type IV secretion protein IcmD [Pseudomonadota bacterium]|nr:type IV secretion protein IcmD [Pseudomonadota bacterium]